MSCPLLLGTCTYWQNSITWDFSADVLVILILMRLLCSEELSVHFERKLTLLESFRLHNLIAVEHKYSLFYMQKIPMESGQQLILVRREHGIMCG